MKKERLYDAFGELIYVLAMADGAVQSSEINTLNKILEDHPWASEIQWSFDYEFKNKHNPDEVYEKAMQTFIDHGPDPEYVQLLDVLEKIAAAHGEVDSSEEIVMLNFQYDFKKRIQEEMTSKELVTEEDLERINKVAENPISGISKDHLYDAFGEIIYVVAMADGLIQDAEKAALKKVLKGHKWASNIKWSFKYEQKNKHDLKELYKKALTTLVANGPDPAYDFLIEILEKVAQASSGMDRDEASIIMDFEGDLREQFIADLEKYELKG